MQILQRCLIPAAIALMILVADIPLLPVELVGEANAVFGVRRRTAVVAYSAGSSRASSTAQQQAAAAQQQAYAAQQQAAAAEKEAAAAKQEAAAAQQQLAAAQAAAGAPIGSIAQSLPAGCQPVVAANVQYQKCGPSFYRAAFQGNSLIYVVVENPM